MIEKHIINVQSRSDLILSEILFLHVVLCYKKCIYPAGRVSDCMHDFFSGVLTHAVEQALFKGTVIARYFPIPFWQYSIHVHVYRYISCKTGSDMWQRCMSKCLCKVRTLELISADNQAVVDHCKWLD